MARHVATPLQVLIARPERRHISSLLDLSSASPVVACCVETSWQVLDALSEAGFDLVVLDLSADDLDPLQLVAMLRTAGIATPVRIVIDRVERPRRVEAARLGGVALVERQAPARGRRIDLPRALRLAVSR